MTARTLLLLILTVALAGMVMWGCSRRGGQQAAQITPTPAGGIGYGRADGGDEDLSNTTFAIKDRFPGPNLDIPEPGTVPDQNLGGRVGGAKRRQLKSETGKTSTITPAPVAAPAANDARELARGREVAGEWAFRLIPEPTVQPPTGKIPGAHQLSQNDSTPNDRDLGKGAGNERLGDPAQPPEKVETPTSERYADIHDNPFVRVNEAGGDASTFAIDVDTASYSNIRRMIQGENRLPPAAAVRIEEMLNYFPYPYPAPTADAKHPFAFATAVAPCPWQAQHLLVRVALKGKVLDRTTRPPLNLVYLVDTSGSMGGEDGIGLVKYALDLLVDQLDARDSLSIVTYAGNVGTALPPTPGDQHVRIRAAIAGHHDGAQSRVILCTDGDFNVGVSDPSELRKLIEQQRASGVFLSGYGFGRGNFQDQTMETLTNHGNGVYGYIDGQKEARKIMVDEALGATVTIAKDVKIQVFFNPTEVAGWRLIGYENRLLRREDFNNDRIDAGDIGAGHTVTALYEIVPAGVEVPAAAASDPNPFTSDYANEELNIGAGTLMQLRLRYKQPDADVSTLQEVPVASTASAMDDDFRFASGVALTGMLLRQSPYLGTGTWAQAASLAGGALGRDAQGLRAEFVGLVGTAKGLK